jgi:hypothetical protein
MRLRRFMSLNNAAYYRFKKVASYWSSGIKDAKVLALSVSSFNHQETLKPIGWIPLVEAEANYGKQPADNPGIASVL